MVDCETLGAWSDKHDDDFLKFERIPESERRHCRPDICAMLLLSNMTAQEEDIVCAAEHDEVYFSWSYTTDDVTEEQFLYLRRCGVFFDRDNYSFASYT